MSSDRDRARRAKAAARKRKTAQKRSDAGAPNPNKSDSRATYYRRRYGDLRNPRRIPPDDPDGGGLRPC